MYKYSIVIPTYNEEKDIKNTLDSLIKLDSAGHQLEILIVDDSTDSTPQIINEYSSEIIKLIRPEKRDGRCGARNIGIIESTGDVVIILNADVSLPINFLHLIDAHYQQGCDYLLVRSIVSNTDDLFARYVECMGILDHYQTDPSWMEWTEGFSCKRNVAMKSGLFPAGYNTAIMAGEDGVFGLRLKKVTTKKVIDFSIVVTHIAPAAFLEYWDKRKERGFGGPQIKYYIDKWPMYKIVARFGYRTVRTIIRIITLIYPTYIAFKICKYSKYKYKDLIKFIYAWFIEQVAVTCGEFQAIVKLSKYG